MTPTIGRIVHYHNSLGSVSAALVVAVAHDQEGVVTLCVMSPSGLPYAVAGVGFSESPVEGCWSWPPKVEAPAPVVDSSAGDAQTA